MAEAAEMQGTPTAPPRRWLRRAATVLLAAVPVLGGSLPAHAVAGAPASTPAAAPAAPSGSRTANVAVNELSPSVPERGDRLTLSGTITNNGDSKITSSHIGLRVGPVLNSRSAIEQASERTGFLAGADAPEIGGHATKIPALAPGVTRSFSITVPVGDLGLQGSGVHQLGVSLTGQTTARPYDQVLGIERTFLPWQTSPAQNRTKLSFMWPLISSSHLTARTESDEQQTPVFRNDDLAEAIAPGGRLEQMVALGEDLPITWVIDPDLLAGVEAMTKSYRVRTEDGDTVAGKDQMRARQWLNKLQEAVRGEDVVALPFGDPDVASLAHHGRKVPGALGRLQAATALASKTVEDVLYTRPSTDFAWPVEGAVDSSVVDVATSAGARNVIARSDSLRESVSIPYTPTAARPIGGGITAVVADHRLSTVFEGGMARAGTSTLAVQRFLAHTLAVTQQLPNNERSLVVAPQRQPTASQAQAMAASLRALAESGRWTQPASLTEAAQTRPDPAAKRSVPGPGAYPDRLRNRELPTDAFRQIRSTQTELEEFAEILSRGDRIETPVGRALDRAMSTSWRGHQQDAAKYRESVQDYLLGLRHNVQLIQKSDLTLSGRSATIPVTVQNNLAQGVDGLKLKLTSSRSLGLRVEDDVQPVVVDGGHSQSVKFSTTAKANGRATVTAQLYTEDNKPYGPEMRFQVKVTSITSTVLLVIAGGVLLVVLAGIRMYTQRKRRGHGSGSQAEADAEPEADDAAAEPPPGEEPSEDQEATADRDDTEQPGEPGRDTGSGDGGPQDTGEKVDR